MQMIYGCTMNDDEIKGNYHVTRVSVILNAVYYSNDWENTNERLGFPFPVFLQGGHACEPDLAFASATRRASRALPIFPRASGSWLWRASWRNSLRLLLRALFFSAWLFRFACRGAASAGWLHSRQDSFFRRPSLCLFLLLQPFFLSPFFCLPCHPCCLHGGALTVCCFFFLCVSSSFIGLGRWRIQGRMHRLQEQPSVQLGEPRLNCILGDTQGLRLGWRKSVRVALAAL